MTDRLFEGISVAGFRADFGVEFRLGQFAVFLVLLWDHAHSRTAVVSRTCGTVNQKSRASSCQLMTDPDKTLYLHLGYRLEVASSLDSGFFVGQVSNHRNHWNHYDLVALGGGSRASQRIRVHWWCWRISWRIRKTESELSPLRPLRYQELSDLPARRSRQMPC